MLVISVVPFHILHIHRYNVLQSLFHHPNRNCEITFFSSMKGIRVRVITGSDRIGGNYGIGPNFPLIYEFYVTFLEYLRPNKQSNHIGSLVGDQSRAYLSLK